MKPLYGQLTPLAKANWIQPVQEYISSFAYLCYWMNEPIGDLTNRGTLGALGYQAVYTARANTTASFQQTGQLGAGEAVTLVQSAGSQSVFTTGYSATLGAITSFEVIALLKVHSVSLAAPRILGGSQGPACLIFTNSTLRMAIRNSSGTNGQALGTTPLTLDTYYFLRFRYDDTGSRTPQLFINNVESAYSNLTAVTGTVSMPTGTGYTWLGNDTGGLGLDGTVDFLAYTPLLTTAQAATIQSRVRL